MHSATSCGALPSCTMPYVTWNDELQQCTVNLGMVRLHHETSHIVPWYDALPLRTMHLVSWYIALRTYIVHLAIFHFHHSLSTVNFGIEHIYHA